MKIIITIIGLLFANCGFSQSWLNNTIGVTNTVPAPWTKIKASKIDEKIQVDCWGRTYIFEKNSIIHQIYSLKSSILESPIDFVAVFDDKEITWDGGSIRLVKNTPAEVTLKLVKRSSDGNITVTSSISITYDGLVFIKLDVKAKTTFGDRFRIDIPVSDEIAHVIHRPNTPTNKNPLYWITEQLSEKDGMIDHSSYLPFHWIGNNDKGIFWFIESPINWTNYKVENAITLIRNKGVKKALISFNFLDSNQKHRNSWHFEFGIQATPVKPLPKAWRNWQLSPISTSNINIIWPEPTNTSLKHFGYPEASDQNRFDDKVRKLSVKYKNLAYNCLTHISSASPEWGKFKNSWGIGEEDAFSSDVKAYGTAPFAGTNPTSKSFADFIIWKSASFLKNTQLKGFYLDNSFPTNINLNNKTGNNLPYYPIMSYRKLYERFYKMVKAVNKNNMIITHASARIVPPMIGFSDAYVTGEQFKFYKSRVKENYLDFTNLEAFQTEFSGKPFGIPAIFLPEFTKEFYQDYKPTRRLVSLLALHDALFWPSWSNISEWEKYKLILNKFPGFATAGFIPYYSKSPIIRSNNRDILGSAYKNEHGAYLFFISNLSKVEKSATLMVSSSLPVKNYKVEKASKTGVFVLEDQILNVTINPGEYMALYIYK